MSPESVPFWFDPKKRSVAAQIGTLCLVGLLSWYLISNVLNNLEKQNIATGFGFLKKESAFEIGESLISYSAADTYAKALLAGVLNTVKVAFIGIVLTIVLGALVGIARLMKMNIPRLSGFNFEGGWTLSPEFMSLLMGLTLYTAAFVAEVVRAGI